MIMDILNSETISSLTDSTSPVEVLEITESTNTYLKSKAALLPEGASVIADCQTAGRGRYTRTFYSPKNCGIYMSVLLRPCIEAEKAVLITAAAAVAVSEAIEVLCKKQTQIKWVNDLLLDSKKVCGILAESVLNPENGHIERTVVGIGINVYKPQNGFDDEIKDIAGFISDDRQENLRNRLCAEIINRLLHYSQNINRKDFLEEYRKRSAVIGKKINVISDNGPIPATAMEIDENCRLLVKFSSGKQEYLNSGEIGIKL